MHMNDDKADVSWMLRQILLWVLMNPTSHGSAWLDGAIFNRAVAGMPAVSLKFKSIKLTENASTSHREFLSFK